MLGVVCVVGGIIVTLTVRSECRLKDLSCINYKHDPYTVSQSASQPVKSASQQTNNQTISIPELSPS